MLQIFTFGTIWFWILALVSSIFIIKYTEDDEDNYGASIIFVLTMVILYFFGNSEFFKNLGLIIIQTPEKFLITIGCYLVIGLLWSIAKWFFFLRKIRDDYDPSYSSFRISNYKASNHKERITHWMMYWPLSAVWTLINDPFKRMFDEIFRKFSSLYDKMSYKMLGDLEKRKEDDFVETELNGLAKKKR
jgi:hypothetical protein